MKKINNLSGTLADFSLLLSSFVPIDALVNEMVPASDVNTDQLTVPRPQPPPRPLDVVRQDLLQPRPGRPLEPRTEGEGGADGGQAGDVELSRAVHLLLASDTRRPDVQRLLRRIVILGLGRRILGTFSIQQYLYFLFRPCLASVELRSAGVQLADVLVELRPVDVRHVVTDLLLQYRHLPHVAEIDVQQLEGCEVDHRVDPELVSEGEHGGVAGHGVAEPPARPQVGNAGLVALLWGKTDN